MLLSRAGRGPALAAVAVASALTGCSDGDRPVRFNPVPTVAASVPPASPTPGSSTATPEPDFQPTPGTSRVVITGEVQMRPTLDFDCSYAIDDFFVRGRLGPYEGVPMYVAINVEFYKRPGRYERRTQVHVRRISNDASFYASWFTSNATSTVLPNGRGTDLDEVLVAPEPGTDSREPIRIGGHFGCLRTPTPGPG